MTSFDVYLGVVLFNCCLRASVRSQKTTQKFIMADTASRQEALAAKRQKQKEREEKWVETQIIGFTSWINSFVTKRGKKVEKLETAFQDGLMLVDFLELAANAKLEGIDKKPKGKIQSLQNLSICLRFVMDGLKVRLLGINGATIYDGNLKLILGMIWSIFRCPKITNIDLGDDEDSKKGKKSFESNLLAWVRERVVNYGLSVTDFKSSFNDGQVFAALIHSIVPESLDFETISPASPAKNLETAFDAGLQSLQVPCLLSIEDMVTGQPDERSVVLYTSLLFHAWTALGAKAVDNQIHAKLQREKEAKERMKDDLAALKAEIAAAQHALSQRSLNSHGLSEENERLRKLLEALQNKSKVADDTIHSLETKVNTLNQLGGDADKKYFRSREGHRDFLAAGADGLTGSSAPNDATSAWFVKPKLAKGSEGKVTIHQAENGKALAAGEGGAVLVDDEDVDEAEWTLVAGPDGGSALKCTKNGEFLQLGADGKVAFAGDHFAVFDILSKSEMTAQEQRARESARIAESFKRAGKTIQIQHNASKDFMASGHGGVPALEATLTDASEWELVLNIDGSVVFRNLQVDCFLNDDGGHVSLGDTCAAKADFWLVKGDDGSILLRNKATNDFVTHGGQKVVTSDGQNLETAGWSLIPRDPELAKSLAGSLAQAGGASLLQNALTRGLVNSTPEVSERVGEDTEWEITATDNGNLVFKSKDSGQYLSSSAKGTIGVAGASAPSSQWNVSRGADGDLLLQNCETGEFLCQKGDGALSCTSSKTENSSWIVKSEDGSFSSSGRSVGDARLGRRVAAGLDAAGGNALIKHSATQQFANNKPELTNDKDSDLSKWNVSANLDGSLTFKSKENGKYLIQAQDGALALADEAEGRKANWGVNMGADGSLEIRNKATGNYLQKNLEGGDLSVASLPHGENSKWDIESDNGAFSSRGLGVTDPSLAAAIGSGLGLAGGAAIVQHATGSDFLNNKPGLSASVGDDSKWEITSNDNGTITIKDKASGNALFQNGDGSLSLSDAKGVASAEWGVTKSKDGDLLIRSALNGNYLMRNDKGDLVSSTAQMGEKSGWVIKSENGLFSSRQAVVGGLRSVGKALAAALAAHGGIAHVQNGASNEYIDNKPGMSADKSALIDFEIAADENGSVSLKSKATGEFLSEGDGGKLEMSKDAQHASSKWTVVKENNGNLVFRNNATEDYLVQQPDGALAAVHSPEGTNEGWKVKSADGTFTSDSNFADYGLEDGFFMGDGMSMRYLEERNARLNREIDEAKDKVDREMRRREEFAKRMGNLKEMGDDNEQRYQELSKTISELEEKADQLQRLFDAEKHRKRQQDEAKAAAERELLEREAILRDAMERRERALKKLDKSKNSAKKEITKRKQREKEIAHLEAMKKQLEQRVAMSERTKVGLESLKRGLEDHLQDLSVWRGHQQMDRQMNDFDLKKISADLEGMPLEQQMDYLDGMLQEENRCLQRISKAQGIAQPSETKILKKGTLSLFGKKEWKPRLCVLSGQNLEYYGNDDVKIGVVDLAMGCDVVRLKAIKDGKTKVWPLKLSINTKVKGDEDGEQQQVVKKLFLRAATKAERQSWFTAVSSATSRINYRAETESSGEKIDPRIFSFISAGEDTPIYELFVDFRPISSAGINALRKGILYHDELHTLSLQQGQIGDEGLSKLTPSLDRLPNLRVVRLSGNRLTSDTVTAALKALTVQTTGLQEIDLSNNIIGVEAVDALAALLKKNPKVNFLNLSGNVLGDDGAVALAKVLQETQTEIPALEVNNNKIGDKGALALTEMANNNLNIGSILLSGNRVSSDGAVGMAELLRDNVNITNLDLSGNNIGAQGAQAFRDCLLDNIDLHVVNLSSNPLLCDDEQLAGMLHVEGFAIKDLSFVRGKSVKVAAKAQAAAAKEEADE